MTTFGGMAHEMRAVVVTEHGGADVLQVQTRPIPEPGPGQLLVEVAASGVNFIDVYRREGVYPVDTPFVLGGECAGKIVAVGDGVTDLVVGDRVATAAAEGGSHATHALIDAANAVRVPAGVELEIAAAAMLQGMTAHYLVHSTFSVTEGTDVLVHAAAGGVGRLLVQMAKAQGARVVGTVGSEKKVAIATDVGADHVIRYDEVDDIAASVRQFATDGVHVVYDGVGRSTFDASLASLRPRGMLVLFGGSSGQVPPLDLQRLNSGGSLFVTRPTLVNYTASRDELVRRASEVLGSIADGSLQIAIGGRYALDDAASAYRDLEGRRTTGKLLLIP